MAKRKPRVISMDWKVHTPNLLKEALSNHGAEMLRTPLRIFADILYAVAERASELNDPELNTLMLRLTLYEAGDPEIHTTEEIAAAFASQRKAA